MSKIKNYLKIKENINKILIWAGILAIIGLIYTYNNWYLPYKHFQEGYVTVTGFDCPGDHPIKANSGSKIYHIPGSTYYNRTSASNGNCFNTIDNAVLKGFRAPFN